MAIALSTLTSRLQSHVPARDGVPSDYDQITKDAVAQLNADAPVRRRANLNIVAGTDSYSLPSDFLFLIGVEWPVGVGDVLITEAGIVPMSVQAIAPESHFIENNQISFIPAPGYTTTLYYRYAAAHVLDESNEYPLLSENAARVALLYGQYLALSSQSEQSGGGWRYQIGDEMVDKSRVGDSLANQAHGALLRYRQAVRSLVGSGGVTARVTSTELV